MTHSFVTGTAFLVLSAVTASAQQPFVELTSRPTAHDPSVPPPAPLTSPVLSAPPTTPELWVYSQEQRRHDDPAQAIRRKAETKADQRMTRLAATKWFGMSDARPHTWGSPVAAPAWNTWPWASGTDRFYGSRSSSLNVAP
jgi:hypothetical protein